MISKLVWGIVKKERETGTCTVFSLCFFMVHDTETAGTPSQRHYVRLANTISHEIIANSLRVTEDEDINSIHDKDLKKALQAYLGWKVTDAYEYVRIISELKFEYKDELRGIATTSDNIDCAQKYLTAVLRFTRFLTDTVHAADIPDAVPNERKVSS